MIGSSHIQDKFRTILGQNHDKFLTHFRHIHDGFISYSWHIYYTDMSNSFHFTILSPEIFIRFFWYIFGTFMTYPMHKNSSSFRNKYSRVGLTSESYGKIQKNNVRPYALSYCWHVLSNNYASLGCVCKDWRVNLT